MTAFGRDGDHRNSRAALRAPRPRQLRWRRLGVLVAIGVIWILVLDRLIGQTVLHNEILADSMPDLGRLEQHSSHSLSLRVMLEVDEARPHALQRVLESLQRAKVADGTSVHLVFHMRYVTSWLAYQVRLRAVRDQIQALQWPYGSKSYFSRSGCTSAETFMLSWSPPPHGTERVVYLPAGFEVSPNALTWLSEADRLYGQDQSIAGVSLLAPNVERSDARDHILEAFTDRFSTFRGFSPNAQAWSSFRKFLTRLEVDQKFRDFEPYLTGLAGEPLTAQRSNVLCSVLASEEDATVKGLFRPKSAVGKLLCGSHRMRAKCNDRTTMETIYARFAHELHLEVVHPDSSGRFSLAADPEERLVAGQRLLSSVISPKFLPERSPVDRMWSFVMPKEPLSKHRSDWDVEGMTRRWRYKHQSMMGQITTLSEPGKPLYLLFVSTYQLGLATNMFCNLYKLNTWPDGRLLFVTIESNVTAELQQVVDSHVSMAFLRRPWHEENDSFELVQADLLHVRLFLVEDLLRRGISVVLIEPHQILFGDPFPIIADAARRSAADVITFSKTGELGQTYYMDSFRFFRPTLAARWLWGCIQEKALREIDDPRRLTPGTILNKKYYSFDTLVQSEAAKLFDLSVYALEDQRFMDGSYFNLKKQGSDDVVSALIDRAPHPRLQASLAQKFGYWFLDGDGSCPEVGRRNVSTSPLQYRAGSGESSASIGSTSTAGGPPQGTSAAPEKRLVRRIVRKKRVIRRRVRKSL